MIGRALHKMGKISALALVVTAAAVVGGASTALVMAAIPSNDGTISACYNKNTGALKVIDAEAGKTCTNKQNPLSWSSGSNSSAGPTVYDADGQALGTFLSSPFQQFSSESEAQVYNDTLGRMMPIGTDFRADSTDTQLFVGRIAYPSFESTDCSGQPYTGGTIDLKTSLFRWGSTETNGIVADNAQSTSITAQSSLFENSFGWQCIPEDTPSSQDNVYPLTAVSLPFNTPIAAPLSFKP
jgi:hypothetical protein